MRKLIFISALVLTGVVASGSVLANYIYPGRVIMTFGFGWGPSTLNAAAMGPGCFEQQPPIHCECEPDMPLLEACVFHGTPLPACLTPDTPYLFLGQEDPPVLIEDGTHTVGSLVCGGQSDGTAKLVIASGPKP